MVGTREIVLVITGSLVLVGILTWWATRDSGQQSMSLLDSEQSITSPEVPPELNEDTTNNNEIANMNNPTATFQTNFGDIVLELYQDQMPITVENFVNLANDGFYDGTKFHRVIPGFMIQGGDPNTRDGDPSTYGTGGPGYTIQDEFVAGELLTNVRGTIAMANTGQPNSGGSQFFINVADNTGLDFDKDPLSSRHPVFGRVIEGMDIVSQIESVETGARDIPAEPVVITTISIATNQE